MARCRIDPRAEEQTFPLPANVFFTGCEREIMDHELPSESQLMADLKATFPALWFRPLREFGKDYANMIGVWTGGSGDMPDGLPIFNELEHGCEEEWDGHVHKGFTAWLELRGWYTETYDAGTYFVIPIAYALEIGAEKSIKEVV